ncbi:MAG: hypothetical protein WCJ30_12575, partial [Deltaproteobacteria bacterium]
MNGSVTCEGFGELLLPGCYQVQELVIALLAVLAPFGIRGRNRSRIGVSGCDTVVTGDLWAFGVCGGAGGRENTTITENPTDIGGQRKQPK